MSFLTKKKKAPAASRQPEENGFGHFFAKKGAYGNGPAGGKLFVTKKKAPAALGQSEENGFNQKYPILSYPIRSYPILPHFKKSPK